MTTDYRHDLQLYDSYVDPQNKPMAYRQENHRLMQVWKRQSLSRVQLFAIPWIVAHQAPLSMEFAGQEHWSWLPFPTPGALPNPHLMNWQAKSLPVCHLESHVTVIHVLLNTCDGDG